MSRDKRRWTRARERGVVEREDCDEFVPDNAAVFSLDDAGVFHLEDGKE